MSVQTAAAGFGVLSLRNKIEFNIPYICSVYLGQDRCELFKSLIYTIQYKLDINNGGTDIIFSDNTGEVLVVMFSGVYVSGVRYNGVARQIPQNMIFNYKGNSYLSNISVDGHMIWIKNLNEIKLKKVTCDSCVSYNSEDICKSIKKCDRAYAHEMSDLWSKFLGVVYSKSYIVNQSVMKSISREEYVQRKSELESRLSKLRENRYVLRN